MVGHGFGTITAVHRRASRLRSQRNPVVDGPYRVEKHAFKWQYSGKQLQLVAYRRTIHT